MKERKYEILPGVAVPDIKSIVDAASDFSVSGVEDVAIKEHHNGNNQQNPIKVTGAAVDELNKLGNQVAEEEEKAAEESRRVMEAIKAQAQVADLSELKKAAEENMTPEKREEIQREQEALAAARAEEEAKAKAREERRLQQQKALEESLARKAAEAEEKAAKEAEEAAAKAKAEKEERIRKQKEEAAARAEARKNEKPQQDDDYKAWVKAKREAAIAEAAEKAAEEEAKKAAEAAEAKAKKEAAMAALIAKSTELADEEVVKESAPVDEPKAEEKPVEAEPEAKPSTGLLSAPAVDFDEDDFEAAMAAIEKQATQEVPVVTPDPVEPAPATPAGEASMPTAEEQQTLDDFSEFL